MTSVFYCFRTFTMIWKSKMQNSKKIYCWYKNLHQVSVMTLRILWLGVESLFSLNLFIHADHTFENSVDPNEYHQDLHCLSFYYWGLTEPSICNNGCVQIKRWKSPYQKLRDESIKTARVSEEREVVTCTKCQNCIQFIYLPEKKMYTKRHKS